MTITWVAGSGVDNSAGAGTTVLVPYVGVPTLGEVRMGILTVEAGPVGGTLNAIAGFTELTPFSGGRVNETGHTFDPHTIRVFYRVFNGTETGNISVGIASVYTGITAVLDVYETTQASWEVPAQVVGQTVNHVSDRTAVLDSAAALVAADLVHIMHGGDRGNLTVAFTAASISQTGATFGAASIRSTKRSQTGTDALVLTASATVTVGSTNVPTVGYTCAASLPLCGPSGLLVLRGSDVEPEEPLILTLVGIAPPSPQIGAMTIEAGEVNLGMTGVMGIVEFGEMALEQGLGLEMSGIPAPSPAVNPAMVIFREGEEPQQLLLEGIAPPSPQVGEMEVSQAVVYTEPPCDWEIISCGEYPEAASVDLINRAERWATELLYMRSGMQFSGCPVTIRPCQQCSGGSYEEWPALSDSGWSGSWVPFLWSGAWSNLPAGCGCTGLHTCTPSQIWLPSTAVSITNVTVDGVALAPSAYRVDNGSLLVRQDGQSWPTTQNLAAPVGDPDTFSITYVPGPPVPLMGKVAAGALALEFVRSCLGLPCRLPAGVQSITRQGVEMTLIQDEDTSWLTGVKEADDFLNTYNPARRRGGWSITTPDIQQPRQTTWSTL